MVTSSCNLLFLSSPACDEYPGSQDRSNGNFSKIGNRGTVAGTSAAIRAFVLRIVEANMPFSLSSYLLGVGSVLGALAFGFGGGVLLTHTAMKESPAGQTRVERLARAEPESPA